MKNTNRKVNDLEFRWTNSLGKNPEHYPEIVRWYNRKDGDDFCCTLLYWVRDREGWDIKFVGDRPFDTEIDARVLWILMQYGQTVASAEFRITEQLNEITLREGAYDNVT